VDIERLAGDPPSPYETEYGFSRVVRAGPFVMVGGTTAVGPGGSVLGQTPAEQTAEVLQRVLAELARLGCEAGDVVQTRVYVTDISRAEEVGRAFGDVFGQTRPLMTMVEVAALIDPRMLVEIEAVAVAPGPTVAG
jgi:enamine deaminase RidA (YjgF/YER057c/UK114 family)